jgi:hypothetical protein
MSLLGNSRNQHRAIMASRANAEELAAHLNNERALNTLFAIRDRARLAQRFMRLGKKGNGESGKKDGGVSEKNENGEKNGNGEKSTNANGILQVMVQGSGSPREGVYADIENLAVVDGTVQVVSDVVNSKMKKLIRITKQHYSYDDMIQMAVCFQGLLTSLQMGQMHHLANNESNLNLTQ